MPKNEIKFQKEFFREKFCFKVPKNGLRAARSEQLRCEPRSGSTRSNATRGGRKQKRHLCL